MRLSTHCLDDGGRAREGVIPEWRRAAASPTENQAHRLPSIFAKPDATTARHRSHRKAILLRGSMLELLVLSVGLAMDAFAVSLVRGASGKRSTLGALEIGLAFGLAQGLMPLIGWGLGRAFEGPFQAFDHWIAFGLLSILGVRMVREATSASAVATPSTGTNVAALATAAFATSIDAAAAGLTLPLLGVTIPLACVTIGVTTAVLCAAGYVLGSRVSGRFGKRAEFAGGLVLIGLGTTILVEHLSA